MDAQRPQRPLHILVLADRDWTHPQTGGNGANIWNQVSRWVAWGHRVTVVAGMYPGAAAVRAGVAPDRHPPHGRPGHRVPARDLVGAARRRPRRRRRARGHQRHHVPDPAVAAQAARGAGAPRPPRALHRRVRPQGPPPGLGPRDAAAALPVPAHALPHDLAVGPRRPRPGRHPARPDHGLLPRRGPRALPPRDARRGAAAHLRRAPEGLQAHRAGARRARGGARREARHRRRRRPPRGAGGRDRAARPRSSAC